MTAGAPVQGVGVGAAPVGVIAICRPGVLEDEKTDKLRTRMFPISNKKQQRFYSSNQGNRGFMSLLRPIDDELSLTATASNDENDNDNDNSDGEEYTDQEQGQSSPTSRYPSSKKGVRICQNSVVGNITSTAIADRYKEATDIGEKQQ